MCSASSTEISPIAATHRTAKDRGVPCACSSNCWPGVSAASGRRGKRFPASALAFDTISQIKSFMPLSFPSVPGHIQCPRIHRRRQGMEQNARSSPRSPPVCPLHSTASHLPAECSASRPASETDRPKCLGLSSFRKNQTHRPRACHLCVGLAFYDRFFSSSGLAKSTKCNVCTSSLGCPASQVQLLHPVITVAGGESPDSPA